MVGVHSFDGRSVEFHVHGRDSLHVWNWRSGLFPDDHKIVRHLAAEDRTDMGAGNPVDISALGCRVHSPSGRLDSSIYELALVFRFVWVGGMRMGLFLLPLVSG